MLSSDTYGEPDYDADELFAFHPSEFEFLTTTLGWESPCWATADLTLRPKSEATKNHFLFGICLPNRWDAFAKTDWLRQSWEAFAAYYGQITGPHKNEWIRALWDARSKIEPCLENTATMFPASGCFIPRSQFTAAALHTMVARDPEHVSVYLVREKRTYVADFLRIHSPPPFWSPQTTVYWFEKRIPDTIHREDVLLWFENIIRHLPKKHHPPDIQKWVNRLAHFEPQLLTTSGADKTWSEKPPVVLMFGPTSKVGSRRMIHFERKDISQITRQKDLVTIMGKERITSTMSRERKAYLLALDETAAQRIERQLMYGEKIHFGLSADLLGIVSRSDDVVRAINVPAETIRQLCVEPHFELKLAEGHRSKDKLYFLRDRNADEGQQG